MVVRVWWVGILGFGLFATPVALPAENKNFDNSLHFPTNSTKNYLKFLDSFRYKFCQPETRLHYNRLVKNYRDLGAYIPELAGGAIDLVTIKKHLPKLREKRKWLTQVLLR